MSKEREEFKAFAEVYWNLFPIERLMPSAHRYWAPRPFKPKEPYWEQLRSIRARSWCWKAPEWDTLEKHIQERITWASFEEAWPQWEKWLI